MDFHSTFPLRFFLNLPKRDDRRASAEEAFFKAGIDVERFPAIDARWVKDRKSYETRQRRACALSHRLAIREAKRRKASAVLIFEDDIELAPGILNALDSIDLPSDWGILYLGCTQRERPTRISNNLVQVHSTCDAHAYAVRACNYDLVLAQLASVGKRIKGLPEAQDQRISLLQDQIKAYACFPNLAWQRVSTSDNLGFSYSNYDRFGRQINWLSAAQGLEGEMLGIPKWNESEKRAPPSLTNESRLSLSYSRQS